MALNSASTTSDSESEVSEVGIYNIKTDDLVFYSWHWSKSLLKKKKWFCLYEFFITACRLQNCDYVQVWDWNYFTSPQAYWSLEWRGPIIQVKLVHLWFWIFKLVHFQFSPCPAALIFSSELLSGRFFSHRGRREPRQLWAGAGVPAVPGAASLSRAGVPAAAGSSRCRPGDSGQARGSPWGCRYLPPVRRVKTVGRPGHSETSHFLSQVRPGFHMEHIPPGQSLHQYKVLMGNISSSFIGRFYKRQHAVELPVSHPPLILMILLQPTASFRVVTVDSHHLPLSAWTPH